MNAFRTIVATTAMWGLILSVAGCRKQNPPPASSQDGEQASKKTDRVERGYVEAVLYSRDIAADTASKQNLTSLAKAAIMYAHSNDGKFPPSLQTMVEQDIIPEELTKDPANKNQPYTYVPGLRMDSPANMILFRQSADGPDGKHFAVTVSGEVITVTGNDK